MLSLFSCSTGNKKNNAGGDSLDSFKLNLNAKKFVLDNGLKIQVPPFIESGDDVIIDTRTIEYVKKI